jgi:putative flippase GtrA
VKDSQKQVIKYILIGISAVLLDFIVYYALSIQQTPIDTAKVAGFIAGSFYTFFLNKVWTWKDKRKTNFSQLGKFFIIYGVSLLINVSVNKLGISILPDYTLSFNLSNSDGLELFTYGMKTDKIIAFFFATLGSAFWNFFGQKYWVFKDKKNN